MPNLNALRMFDAAARHLNFRLAAEELNLTQGAVAQQIRKLEADLGHNLFERQARGVALTDTGRTYHGPVRRALALIEDATAKLRPESTRITISVTPSFAAKWLVPRLSRLNDSLPDIDLQTVASERLASFTSDGIDLAIRQGVPPFGARLNSTLLAPLDLCAVTSADLAARIGPIEAVGDLAAHRLVQDSHSWWERLFSEAGVAPAHRMLQMNQTALAMDAAANGQGIAIAPKLLAAEDIESGRLVPVWQQKRSDQNGYYLVYPETKRPNPAREAVIGWILAEAKIQPD